MLEPLDVTDLVLEEARQTLYAKSRGGSDRDDDRLSLTSMFSDLGAAPRANRRGDDDDPLLLVNAKRPEALQKEAPQVARVIA
jgi:hypothetical protein